MVDLTCSVPTCDRPPLIGGLCRAHYSRLRDTGDLRPNVPIRRKAGSRATARCLAPGCGRGVINAGYCPKHSKRVRAHGSIDPPPLSREAPVRRPVKPSRGYIVSQVDGRRRVAHRVIMEEMLGRTLLPGETVHHRNGVKHDNRPANLELWCMKQPRGQRPEDLVAWANEILARYGTDFVQPRLRL